MSSLSNVLCNSIVTQSFEMWAEGGGGVKEPNLTYIWGDVRVIVVQMFCKDKCLLVELKATNLQV